MEEDIQNTGRSLPRFIFLITIDGNEAAFKEVSGLDMESKAIEYRHNNSKNFTPIKMPGISKTTNITLKRGMFKNSDNLSNWLAAARGNKVNRSTVVIKLLDESSRPVMTWTLQNAWPVKIQSTDMNASGNEVAIESLELACEGITISNP